MLCFLGMNLQFPNEAAAATFSDANWLSMGGYAGANFDVNAIVEDSGSVYVGGGFTIIGDAPAQGVAKWDGRKWLSLGSGLNGDIRALAVLGTNVYVGGLGLQIPGSGNPCPILKWNGSTWRTPGFFYNASDASINALAISGNDLYAAGAFWTSPFLTNTFTVARWNGTDWFKLPSTYNVRALAISGSNVYAGGYFTSAGGVAATNIAKWDGNSWSVLGPGINMSVYTLAISGNDLYAGGYGRVHPTH
jgi:hypothetical protein